MASTMDALASFSHLVDNLPSWLSKLDKLSIQVTEHHEQFMKLTRTAEAKFAQKKSASTESLRPGEQVADLAGTQQTPNTAASIPPSTAQLHKVAGPPASKEARRKRKPGSALSTASTPLKYRTRSMVIVYYDSETQESFEALVRNIATARNNLRKGKTAATFKSRMASIGMGATSFSAGVERGILDPKLMLLAKRNKPDPNVGTNMVSTAFDTVDKDLEKAQSLCESAAHQFLRDGDCQEDIRTIRDSFQKCFDVAQEEYRRLQHEKASETQEEEDTQTQAEEMINIDLSARVEPPTTKPVQFAGVGAIEVDDDNSDAESIQIDMSAIRRTTRRV